MLRQPGANRRRSQRTTPAIQVAPQACLQQQTLRGSKHSQAHRYHAHLPQTARLITHIMSIRALPHKSGFGLLYEARAISAPKFDFVCAKHWPGV